MPNDVQTRCNLEPSQELAQDEQTTSISLAYVRQTSGSAPCHSRLCGVLFLNAKKNRTWVNAQRDGRPLLNIGGATLYNAAKFG